MRGDWIYESARDDAIVVWVADGDAASPHEHRWLDDGLSVRTVRGSRMRTEPALFDEVSAALQFPGYFGHNWAALDECICDMDWQPLPRGYVVVIREPLEVLSQTDAGGLAVFVRVLATASQTYRHEVAVGESWDRPPIPFHVLLQCETESVPAVRERWSAVGAELRVWSPASDDDAPRAG